MPIDREKVLQAAQKHVEKKRFDRAIVEYQKLVDQDPNDYRTLLMIGDLQVRSELFEDAIASYEKGARLYASRGSLLKAIAVYKEIRGIIRAHVPHLADRFVYIIPKLAQFYEDLGLMGDALSAYDEYATHLQRIGHDQQAIEIFRKLVEINANNPLTRLRLAEALTRQKQTDEAMDQFSLASDILLGMDRSDDALKVFERMLVEKQDPLVARKAAEIYLKRGHEGDGMQALAKLQICFQADNRDLTTLQLLARAFEVIGQAPKATEVRKELARIARDKGQLGIARETVHALLEEAPQDETVQTLAKTILALERASIRPQVRTEVDLQPPSRSGMGTDDVVIEVSEEIVDIPEFENIDIPASTHHQAPYNHHGVSSEDSIEELEPLTDGGRDLLSDYPFSSSSPNVYVPDGFQGVEDFRTETGLESSQDPQQTLATADAYRSQGEFDKALQTLLIALELDPHAYEIRFVLKDLLIEMGDYASACDHLVFIANSYIEAQDHESGAQFLSEILMLDPNHQYARDLLTQLGYDVESLPQSQSHPLVQQGISQSMDHDLNYSFPSPYDTDGSYEHAEPLPSYDLEEINPSYALSSVPSTGPADYSALLATDDPFSVGDNVRAPLTTTIDEPFTDRAPLPSFPLTGENLSSQQAEDFGLTSENVAFDEDFASYEGGPWSSQPSDGGESLYSTDGLGYSEQVAAPLAGTRAFRGGDSLEDALEEAEFFASRGLFEDALSILQEQEERFPNHPLLMERLQEISEAMTAAASGERAVPVSHRPHLEVIEDNAFDIAASLDAFDPGGRPAESASSFGKAIDVEEVFAKFKEGVREQVSESDSQTRFDLGVAYKEMGLLEDAVSEFALAARDPKRESVCWSMIGIVKTEQGDLDGAIEAFIRGLHAQHKTIEQELSLYFDLGVVYQTRENPQEAMYYFEKVARKDPEFRDVAQRMRSLQTKTQPSRVKSTSNDDEFDQAFDDLFSTSKLSQG